MSAIEGVSTAHTHLFSLADALALDAAVAADKAPLPGQPLLSTQEKRRQDQALHLQIQSQNLSPFYGD